MGRTERTRIIVTGLILTLASFLFFQLYYAYHLFFTEQMQLFLLSSDYLGSYFTKPAWLSCLIGDFLTQFFYFRGGGPFVIAIVLALEYFTCEQIIKRIANNQYNWLWSIVPVAIDWSQYLKLSYNLSSSIAFILALLLFLLYLKISKWKVFSLLFGILITIGGYWLAGSSIFMFPILVLLFDSLTEHRSFVKWKILFFAVWLAPYIFLNSYLLPISELYIFPGTTIQTITLPLGLIISIVIAYILRRRNTTSTMYNTIVVSVIFSLIVLTGLLRNASFNFEKILALDSETYFNNPEEVIELVNKYQLKSKYASYYTNIALAQQELLPEKLLDYYQPGDMGLILPVAPTESRESIIFSNEAFFMLGDMNLAQHSAMLGNTFSTFQRSSRMIKRLAEINLVIGDLAAANKYLRLLDKTLFHRKWAHAHKKMNMSVSDNSWLTDKRKLLPGNDTIRRPDDYLAALQYLAEQHPENKPAVDYLLCSFLLNKDLNSFKRNYDRYIKPRSKTAPKVYSEALLITLFREGATQEETLAYGISTKEINGFMEYTKIFEENKGALEPLEKRFGKTYWYYYHFAKLVTN